jgi:septal ring factor EnvC (AmiA/AmiB activator)
MKAIVM